ncbi:MAG: hypothetical protein H6Q16_201 [Bacteroidetes bacterium]|nr:hypothetical protein [Bacteroidota bacterium]
MMQIIVGKDSKFIYLFSSKRKIIWKNKFRDKINLKSIIEFPSFNSIVFYNIKETILSTLRTIRLNNDSQINKA